MCARGQAGLGLPTDQIADRLEGKPEQVVDATVDDHRTVHEFSDAELTAILRRRVRGANAKCVQLKYAIEVDRCRYRTIAQLRKYCCGFIRDRL
jgi:hypothetical protein